MFHCYGRRSNADLLAHYGFALGCNKYEALTFRATVDFGWRKQFEEKGGAPAQADDMKVQKKIKLKETRLRDEIFAYIRATLMNQQGQKAAGGSGVPEEFIVRTPEGEERKVSRDEVADQSHLLVSSPVDPAFELLVVAFAIQLLQQLEQTRFKFPREKDRELLGRGVQPGSGVGWRQFTSVLLRHGQRRILERNL